MDIFYEKNKNSSELVDSNPIKTNDLTISSEEFRYKQLFNFSLKFSPIFVYILQS